MREPVAIGFYPEDSEKLRQSVEDYLKEAKVKEFIPKGLVVPHAGYPFSGSTAAHAYKSINGKEFSRVILLGPNHYGVGANMAVSKERWKTPLGVVETDEEFCDIICENSGARIDEKAHKREHSIEVQLPFLQTVLEDFEIVPISIKHNFLDVNSLEDLGEILQEVKDEDTLIIASSDLVHFGTNYRYMPVRDNRLEFVKEKDRDFIDKIVQFDSKGVLELGEETTICGYGGIFALIRALKEKCDQVSLLDHSTSYDKTEDENNIVGYASLAIF